MKDNLVLLIPSYDPNEKLVATAESMIAAGFSNIVIVNDGSKEKNIWPFETLEKHEEVTVIGYEENHGKGFALKYGYRYIIDNYPDCEGVVTCDGDGQHLATDCVRVANALEERNELIFGCRRFKGGKVPLHNKIGNLISVFVYNILCEIKLSDTQTGLRGVPAKYLPAFTQIEGDRFEYETNTLLFMRKNELPYSEVSISTIYEEDSNKGSHFKVFEDSVKIYKPLIKFGGPKFLSYIASSLGATVIDLSVFTLMNWLISKKQDEFIIIIGSVFMSTFVARVCSSLFNYFFNKRIFGSTDRSCILRYYILTGCQLSASAFLVMIISKLFGALGIFQTIVKCIVDMGLFFACYKIQREWVFKK